MWLIDVHTYALKYFQDVNQVSKQYAILSHRWEEGEVTFRDINNIPDAHHVRRMKGWYKIAQCCNSAKEEGLKYAWVDTCCIDKSSSAELQESINSMFRWYTEAKVCYVYLSDFSLPSKRGGQFSQSLWFTRGWTLQELIAPEQLEFYDKEWQFYGTRNQHKIAISNLTGIPKEYLAGFNPQWVGESAICVAEIMSWAANRKTTRVEDRAYSLIGLFGVSMPLLYGEGDKAFRRLQEELLRSRDDQSIFAWKRLEEPHELSTALADSPDNFVRPPGKYQWLSPSDFTRRKAHSVSNEGINIELDLLPIRPGVYHAVVNALLYNSEAASAVQQSKENVAELPPILALGFPVREIDIDGRFVRLLGHSEQSLVYYPLNSQRRPERRQVTLVNYLKRSEVQTAETKDPPSFLFPELILEQWALLTAKDFLPEDLISDSVVPVQAPVPENASVFCRYTGWPHKLYWSLSMYEIRFIALGFDFDFNPVCLVIVGNIDNASRTAEALERTLSIRGGFNNLPDNPDSKGLPFEVHRGTYTLLTSPDLKINEKGTLILAAKSRPSSRASGEGFQLKLSFGEMYGKYFSGGHLQVQVSRQKNDEPWQVEIAVESSTSRHKYFESRNFKDIVRVSPFPAHRLGTWAEADARNGHGGALHEAAMLSDDENTIL